MNLYLKMLGDALDEAAGYEKPVYAFRITKDFLDDGADGEELGPDHLIAELDAGHGKTFILYTEGVSMGELDRCYEGRMVVDESHEGTSWNDEEIHSAPLRDFGVGYGGCTVVKWPGHPDWACS
ncbi:hypothetical protein [Kribbella sindirgiensis]|uniref:Uncharacterized protein n=1 Tax=Kribbella sindirgiensis TaxID=1124744 RepID=A0A4R0I3J6_9ACTN|nr:hypothetical protein [Kribbella sindirgiensis]TCC19937.1 hypothetical protein E0H50_37540 [Kribbella sindirgiensis]